MASRYLLGGALAFGLTLGAAGGVLARPQAPDAPAALPTPDYLTAAAQSDEFETQEGTLAASMGKSARVRDFGQMMVRDHTMTTKTLMAAAMKAGMSPPPPPLRPDQAQMIDQLKAMSGADFDRTYVMQQVAAHKEALMVHQGYAANGADKPLRKAAKSAVPIVEHHLSMVTAMQTAMGGA